MTDMREAFEAWATKKGYEVASRKPDGRYWFSHTHDVWEAWQAASKPPEGMVVVPELPTPMMLKAGGLVLHRDEDCQMDEDPYRERGQAAHCWIEMLAARPKGGE